MPTQVLSMAARPLQLSESGSRHEPECNRNYQESSGGMEAQAAEHLWTRSLNHGFRYTTMLSDGDAKTFNHLTSLHVYGDVELQKEECVNHVAKRPGTALRKCAASGKKAGITLGGKGHGKLKQRPIDSLTVLTLLTQATYAECCADDIRPCSIN